MSDTAQMLPVPASSDFERLVANLSNVVFRLDRELRHLFISPVIESWTGISPQNYIGKTMHEVGAAPPACEVFEAAARRALAHGKTEVVQFSDHDHVYRSRLVPERDANGSVAGHHRRHHRAQAR